MMSRSTDALLKEAGFAVSEPCLSRPSCFDFAARKDERTILIRLQEDITHLLPSNSRELRLVADSVSASSLLIGEKAREKPLEDDTVYSRYNVLAVTPKTFENIVVRRIYPLVQAGPGGYYVEIDSEAIKQKRQQLDLSAGAMAEIAGLSRRTLYGYERGMAKASVTAAYNLICTLGIPVARSVDIFEKPPVRFKCFLTKAREALVRSKILQKVFKRLARWNITPIKKAPFDFVIAVPEENMRIIGGVTGEKEPELKRRVDEILSFSDVIQAHPVLITESHRLLDEGITCISSEELINIKKPEDLIKYSK